MMYVRSNAHKRSCAVTPEYDCPEKMRLKLARIGQTGLPFFLAIHICGLARKTTITLPSAATVLFLTGINIAQLRQPQYIHTRHRQRLQDQALLRLLLFPGEQGSSCGVLENLSDTLVRLCGALEVLLGSDLLADILGLFWGYWLLGSLVELLNGLLVEAQILLAANKDDGQALAEVKNLGDPLLLHVVERVGGINSEANQNNVRVGV